MKTTGFVPAASGIEKILLCRRCFRLRHYGQVEAVALSPDDYLAIVSDAVARADLLLYDGCRLRRQL